MSSARVCAGLQTGAGAEALYLDDMQLVASAASTRRCGAMPLVDYSTLPSCTSPQQKDEEHDLSPMLWAVFGAMSFFMVAGIVYKYYVKDTKSARYSVHSNSREMANNA